MTSAVARIVGFAGMLAAIGPFIVPTNTFAQTPFTRNDAYPYRGTHAFAVHGTNPNDLYPEFSNTADFRSFICRFKAQGDLGPALTGPFWYLNRITVDFDVDGVTELTTTDEVLYTHTFPEPTNGVSQTHTVKVKLQFLNPSSQGVEKDVYLPVTVFATPRVFVDSVGNSFTQLRNEECGDKIPLLVVEGIDVGNGTFHADLYKQMEPILSTELYPRGYEVFILNFLDAGDDIRDNAAVVMQALAKLHELCPNYPTAVVGLSMGGVITRYALAKAENDAVPHHVGFFLSYDSPQKAAHANRTLQDAIRQLPPNNQGVIALQQELQSMAAQQMLDYSTYNPSGSVHWDFYNELNALNGDGYPHQSYNVAISNGNYLATWPVVNVNTDLGTLTAWTEGAWTASATVHIYADATDCASGSKTHMKASYGTGGPALPGWMWAAKTLVTAFVQFDILFDPVFMPTWSTLDLQGHAVDVNTGNVDPIGTSKFADVFIQSQAMYHSDFTPAAAAKILAWLGHVYPLRVASTAASQQALYPGASATCVAVPMAGVGAYTYAWEARNIGYSPGDFAWTSLGSAPSAAVTVTSWYDKQVRVTISDGVTTVCDTLACIANLTSSPAPLATVAGLSVLPAGSNGTWTVNTYQGRKCGDNPAYEWRTRPLGSSTWSQVIGTAKTLTWPTYSSTATELQAKVLGETWGAATLTVWQSLAAISDFAPEVLAPTEIWVTWTAPGVAGLTGDAVAYDLRKSVTPINSDQTFYMADQVTTEAPKDPGEWEELIVSGLTCNTYYYMAIKVQDQSGAWSPISNVIHPKTINSCNGGYGNGAGPAAAGALNGSGDQAMAASSSSSQIGAVNLEWSVSPAGGVLTIGFEPDSNGATGSVLSRDAATGGNVDSDAEVETREWTTCGLVLRARDERVSLGAGWRPIALFNSAVFADAGNEVVEVRRVTRARDGVTTELDSASWGQVFDSFSVGDNLHVEYAKEGADATEDGVSAWILLQGPAGTVPLPGRVPQAPAEAGGGVPDRLELRVFGGGASRSTVRLELAIPRPGLAKLEILDVSGRRVSKLVDEWRPEGRHTLTWDGRDDAGGQVRAGVYFCRLISGRDKSTAKLVWGVGK